MNIRIFGSAFAASALAATLVMAQPPEGGQPDRGPRDAGGRPEGDRGPGGRPDGRGPGGPGGPRGPFGPPPFFTALDADGDGKITTAELENAATALKTLDKNNDGVLTPEELGPPRPSFGERGPREGGRPGFGGGSGNPGDFLKMLDKDGDGKVSKAEAPERMQEGFDRMDTNKDGFIDEAEVRQMMDRFREMRPGGPGGPRGERDGGGLQERMKAMDKDGDGKVSLEEAPERMKQSFDRFDTNKDGFIDDAEIRQMMDRAREAGPRP